MNLAIAKALFLDGYFSLTDHQPQTKKAYEIDLCQFLVFAGKERDIDLVDSGDVEDWASELKSKNYSISSIRRKLVVLKVFFGYITRKGFIAESPFWKLKFSFGRSIRLPRTLSEIEIEQIIKQAHRETDLRSSITNSDGVSTTAKGFLSLRNMAIVEILFATGMRVGEMSTIDIPDFLIDESAFRIRGKGGKERLAHLVDATAKDAQTAYLCARGQLELSTSALFINARGSRLSTQGIRNIVRKIQRKSGAERHTTPHMFRHTVATLLLRNGMDIRVVQEFLGHASIATTQIYTQVSKSHLVYELNAKHPSLAFR